MIFRNIFNKMRTRNLGVAIVTIGIIMMFYTVFNDIGLLQSVDEASVKINKEKNKSIQWWLPVLSFVLIGGGGTIVVHHEKNSLD